MSVSVTSLDSNMPQITIIYFIKVLYFSTSCKKYIVSLTSYLLIFESHPGLPLITFEGLFGGTLSNFTGAISVECAPRICQTYLQERPSYFNSTINIYYEYTSG
jgi:hypothetical protein